MIVPYRDRNCGSLYSNRNSRRIRGRGSCAALVVLTAFVINHRPFSFFPSIFEFFQLRTDLQRGHHDGSIMMATALGLSLTVYHWPSLPQASTVPLRDHYHRRLPWRIYFQDCHYDAVAPRFFLFLLMFESAVLPLLRWIVLIIKAEQKSLAFLGLLPLAWNKASKKRDYYRYYYYYHWIVREYN